MGTRGAGTVCKAAASGTLARRPAGVQAKVVEAKAVQAHQKVQAMNSATVGAVAPAPAPVRQRQCHRASSEPVKELVRPRPVIDGCVRDGHFMRKNRRRMISAYS